MNKPLIHNLLAGLTKRQKETGLGDVWLKTAFKDFMTEGKQPFEVEEESVKNLRFCFEISKEVGLAEDEDGNKFEAYVCAKAKNVMSYEVPCEEYKKLQESFRKVVAKNLECDEKYVKPITLNEYLDNTEEDDDNE